MTQPDHAQDGAADLDHGDSVSAEDPDPRATDGSPPTLSDEFWSAAEILGQIRDGAQSRLVGPDALLANVVARCVAATPPTLRLPAIVGSAGSLNLVVGVIGSSGMGKGASVGLGREIAPFAGAIDIDGYEIGSGEGLAECYIGSVEDEEGAKVRRQVHDSALMLADEGQTIVEQGRNRRGSTLLPALRTAWSGNQLGQANASPDRRRHLDAHSYRLCAVVGFQPAYAAAILDDDTGGTPQRFWWVAVTDPAAPDVLPEWPGEVDLRAARGFDAHFDVDERIVAEIQRRRSAVLRGELVGVYDGHRDLLRLKIAAGLSLLVHPDVLVIGDDDWRLAGMVCDTSDGVRDWLLRHQRQEAALKRRADESKAAGRQVAIEDAKEQRAREKGAKAMARRAHRQGRLKRKELKDATASRDREHASVDSMVAEAVRHGWITELSDGFYGPGDSQPA